MFLLAINRFPLLRVNHCTVWFLDLISGSKLLSAKYPPRYPGYGRDRIVIGRIGGPNDGQPHEKSGAITVKSEIVGALKVRIARTDTAQPP